MTAKVWCEKFNLICAINAGMYHKDGITHVGYCKNYDHINSRKLNKDNTILAFNPVDTTVPEIQIIDRQYQDYEKLRKKYNSLSQSIRMITCKQKNVWTQQPKKWSTAAIGLDTRKLP